MISIYSQYDLINEISMQKDYKDEMSRFFPTLLNSFGSSIQTFLPIFTPNDVKFEKKINKIVEGINIKTCINSSPSPNAWTIPAITGKKTATILTLASIAIVPTIIYSFYGIQRLHKNPITLRSVKNGKIILNTRKDIDFLSWTTKGLKNIMTHEQQIAISLHEIGHWINYKTPLIAIGLKAFSSLFVAIPPLQAILMFLSNMISRTGEYEADNFVKQTPYRDHLIDAFKVFNFGKREEATFIVTLSDMIRVFMMNIHNKIDKYVPFISTHPSMKNRISKLKENSFNTNSTDQTLYENTVLMQELNIMSKFTTDIKEKLMGFVQEQLKPIDKLLSQNIKTIMPIHGK